MPLKSLTILLLATALIVPSTALGAPQSGAVADCNAHGQLTHQYTDSQLRIALGTMPADVKEYTDCYDVIQRALLAQVGSVHDSPASASGGSGGSFLPTPVIVVLVVLVAVGAALGALALRRRGGAGGA